MREVVTLHIGQAGVQQGIAMWDQLCLEHSIGKDGFPTEDMNNKGEADKDPQAFFWKSSMGKYVPRTVMIDTEADPISSIRNTNGNGLFDKTYLLTGGIGSGSSFGRGYKCQPCDFLDNTVDKVRKQMELCDGIQGILLLNSISGGTGSGFGAYILNQLEFEDGKKDNYQLSIYPSPKMASITVAPYNSCFFNAYTMDDMGSGISMMVDNWAIGNIIKKNLRVKDISFVTMNKLISQVISQLTVCHRGSASIKATLRDLQTNLIPFPRLRNVAMSFAPVTDMESSIFLDNTVRSITDACFESINTLSSCDIYNGKFISCCMMYRGKIQPREANDAVSRLMGYKTLPFVPWVKSGIKISIGDLPHMGIPGSDFNYVPSKTALMMMNTTATDQIWKRIHSEFKLMYGKKAFLHWFLEDGMEMTDFDWTLEIVNAMLVDYRDALL